MSKALRTGRPQRLAGVEARLSWAEVQDEVGEGLSALSDVERERLSQISHGPTARIHVSTRRLVRRTLSEVLGREAASFRFGTEAKGRPYLVGSGEGWVDFNVAHARSLVVMAWCRRGRVGVDIEPVDREVDHELVARRFFHAREVEALADLDDEARPRRFMALWVLKEAWMKADGRGIGAGLSNVVYAFEEGGEPRLVATPGPEEVDDIEVALQEVEGHWVGLVRRPQLAR